MLESVAPNAPKGMNCTSRAATIGCGSPPMCPYGLSNPPGGFSISERLPHGGDCVLMLWRSAVGKSYATPYEVRTAIRPSPVTSHATPTRGEKFHHFGTRPVFPPGKPGSPG